MLSDLGAEVIKVEPPMGDMTRFAMPRVNSLSSYFIQQNVGKKNISLDMTKPQAVELLKKLVSHCDVVIENFRPGVMHKMGLDYETLSQLNPRLIYTSITGYGATEHGQHAVPMRLLSMPNRELLNIKAMCGVDNTQMIRIVMAMCTQHSKQRVQSWLLCISASTQVLANTSTCRWPRPCCT